MISSGSRYVNADIVPMKDGSVSAFRNFPEVESKTMLYTWSDFDRLDRLAARFLGDPALWWKILDLNPIIQSPNDIRAGMQIRVPNGR